MCKIDNATLIQGVRKTIERSQIKSISQKIR